MGEIALQTSWGVQIALYLFLGGLAGGTALVTGIVQLKQGERFKNLVRFGAWAAVLLLLAGVLCLVTEVTMPLRAMQLWRAFTNPTSWMTIGAWLLVAGIVATGLFALAATPAIGDKVLGQKAPAVKRVLAIISAVLGACIAIYTGILLCVLLNHPLWNTPLLPVLFTVSAFDTGIALICTYLCLGKPLGAAKEAPAKDAPSEPDAVDGEKAATAMKVTEDAAVLGKMTALLEKCSVGLIAAEAVVLAVLLLMTSGAGEAGALSAWVLTTGPLAVPFWVILIVAGLAVPLVLELLQLKGNHAKWMALASPLLILVGGCALRFLILYAGLPLAL